MNNIEPEYEKKILLDVVTQMEDVNQTSRKQATLSKLILGLGTAGLTVAFILAINEATHPLGITVLGFMSGFAVGFGLLLEFMQKQWPITRQHINMESVRKRLGELENLSADGNK
jgi:hypothetical protein